MFLGFAFIIGGLGLLMILERIFPDRNLVEVPGWWMRVLTINLSQLIIVVAGAYSWERFFQTAPTLFRLQDFVDPAVGGLLAYLINSWIFYWFHRARHEVYLFWVLFHQVHHSAQRIEAITSFYKHPLEIIVDSVLMSILLYPILGLSPASSIWLSIFSAYGEYFYHMNIKTPRWIGYFFQRPESHRIHHLRNKRENCKNYSDFPFWDMLGDTFQNPEVDTVATGFLPDNEVRFGEMLLFQDVLPEKEPNLGLTFRNLVSFCLLIIGLIQPIGYLFDQPAIRGLGAITTASPLPLVFSAYNGVETYATSFKIDLYFEPILDDQGYPINTFRSIDLTKAIYSGIKGPYNRRNVFGVLFSHGPFFVNPGLVQLRDHLLRYALCEDGLQLRNREHTLTEDLILDLILDRAEIKVRSNTQNGTWSIWVRCKS